MASLTAGTTFTDGVANDVTAAKLGALVTAATPTSGLIQDRTAETVVGTNDTLLIGDASDSNNLKRMTVANLLKAPLVSTSGTVDNLTTGTTTSTAQIVTSGTIATLNSTTGTITNLSATTSTFLGTITGSTNVVNIGSGQIYKDASGNVGIGTTSLSAKLNVYDASSAVVLVQGDSVAQTIINRASADASSPSLVLRKSRGSVASPTAVASTDALGLLNFQGFGGTNNRNLARIGGNVETYVSDGDISANLTFLTSSTGGVTPTEKMRIDASGNVGIGVASPEAKIHVQGAGTTSGSYTNGDADGQALYLQDTGASQGNGGQILFGASSGIFAGIKGFLDNGTGPAGSLILQTRTTTGNVLDRVRIDSSGNVGIGTASPATKLDVAGEVDAKNVTVNVNTLATASGTQNLDFTSEGYLTHAITGNITYTASNYSAGRSLSIRITCDATQRNLTFPASWVFVGSKPTAIAASKVAVLSVTSFGATEANTVAAYAVQT